MIFITKLEAAQTQSGVEVERRIVMEAALVRIMKARKELRHSALIEEVITFSHNSNNCFDAILFANKLSLF